MRVPRLGSMVETRRSPRRVRRPAPATSASSASVWPARASTISWVTVSRGSHRHVEHHRVQRPPGSTREHPGLVNDGRGWLEASLRAGPRRAAGDATPSTSWGITPSGVDRQTARHLPTQVAAQRFHRLGVEEVLQRLATPASTRSPRLAPPGREQAGRSTASPGTLPGEARPAHFSSDQPAPHRGNGTAAPRALAATVERPDLFDCFGFTVEHR